MSELVSVKFLLKSFANAHDFRGRNVGFKTFFFCLLSFPILNPRGTGKDYIYIRNIMGCPMCSLGKENLVVKVVIKFSSLYIV